MTVPAQSASSETPLAQINMATAANAPAPMIALRSPWWAAIHEAGRLNTSEPTPISVTTSAASATEPPRSRTPSATTGRIAPSPTPNSSEGPFA